jgi:hypothetical protein
MRVWFSTCVLVASLASPAAACTVCDSPRSAEFRTAFLQDADFARNLAAAVLPSTVFLALVGAVHFGLRERRDKNNDDNQTEDRS